MYRAFFGNFLVFFVVVVLCIFWSSLVLQANTGYSRLQQITIGYYGLLKVTTGVAHDANVSQPRQPQTGLTTAFDRFYGCDPLQYGQPLKNMKITSRDMIQQWRKGIMWRRW